MKLTRHVDLNNAWIIKAEIKHKKSTSLQFSFEFRLFTHYRLQLVTYHLIQRQK